MRSPSKSIAETEIATRTELEEELKAEEERVDRVKLDFDCELRNGREHKRKGVPSQDHLPV
jgi:hypothetical protein